MSDRKNTEISTLTPERTPEIVAAEIRTFTASMLNNIIEIGRRLVEVRQMLPYGQFGAWVRENTGYSSSTANNFMKLYMEYGSMQGSLFGAETESQTFGKLSYSKALALLAVPAEERENFAGEVDAEHLSVRELKDAIRERDEAKKALEQSRQALEKSEKQLAAERSSFGELSNKMAGLRDELQEAKQAHSDANAAVRQAEETAAALRKELHELKKNMPDDQVMEETVRKATEKAVAEIRTKLEKAKADKKQADEKRKAAEQALADMKSRTDAEVSGIREQLASAQAEAKKAAAGNDKDIASFSAWYEQAKDVANRMHGVLLKIRTKNPQTAEKLENAMKKLGEAIMEAAK